MKKNRNFVLVAAFTFLLLQVMLGSVNFSTVSANTVAEQIFFDGFDSGNFTAGGWTKTGTASVVTNTVGYTSKLHQGSNIVKGIGTQGYQDITLSFSFMLETEVATDVLAVEWFDGSQWNLIENISDMSYSWVNKTYNIGSNANNNPNFKIRFAPKFNDSADMTLVDNVKVSGAKSPLMFQDKFESGNFTAGGWTVVGNSSVVSYTGNITGNYSSLMLQGASIEKAVSTQGFQNITLSFSHSVETELMTDVLKVEWYDGTKWNLLADVTSSLWEAKKYALPAGADNNLYFKVRFSTKFNDTLDRVFLDNVTICGSTMNPSGFLIIVSNPLYKTGTVAQDIAKYKAEVDRENGWNSKIVKVNNINDSTADKVCADAPALKQLIKEHYNLGFKGFVFIGSAPTIPVAYYDATKEVIPTDLYFADMEDWGPLNAKNAYTTLSTGTDIKKYSPEMFYGRISAGCIATSADPQAALIEEATFVSKYLTKVVDYKRNGSNLTPEQQKRVFLFYDHKDYKGYKGDAYRFRALAPEIHGLYDDSLTTPDKYLEKLKYGYQFVSVDIHSGYNAHGIHTFLDVPQAEVSVGRLNTVKNDINVHYINLFSCNACQYISPTGGKLANLGATYLFNNNFMLNVTGSTASWGTVPQEAYWNKIAAGTSIGVALQEHLAYLLSTTDRLTSAAVLLGDPTIKYKIAPVTNKTPILDTNLAGTSTDMRLQLASGTPFTMYSKDETGDVVTIDVTGLPLNAAVQKGNGYFTWTPSSADAGKIHTLTVTAYNKNTAGQIINKYVEEFSVEVHSTTLFSDSFESGNFTTGGWTNSGCNVSTEDWYDGTKSAKINNNASITKSFSTVGYKDIIVKYARGVMCDAGENLICEWYNGTSWNAIDTYSDTSGRWYEKTWILPAGANGNSNFKIRFRAVLGDSTDLVHIDKVSICGGRI